MSTRYNFFGGLVTDSLILNLDAAKLQSYPGTGTNWINLINNSISGGTLINGPTLTGSGKNLAITFDGTNDYAVSSNSGLNLTELTICAWVNFNSISNSLYPTITNKETSNLNRNWWLGLLTDGKFTFGRSVSGVDSLVQSTITPNLNQWYFVCCTNDLLPTFKIYINGNLNNTNVLSGTLSTNGNQNWIGTYAGGGTYPMEGKISNVQIYNRALSQAEITQNFNALRGRYGI
jgi:hypothetical protein